MQIQMHALLVLIPACLVAPMASPAVARQASDSNLEELISQEAKPSGKRTRLTKFRCADTGGAGLVCKTDYKGRVVAIDAKQTGSQTPSASARRFEVECGGLTGFGKPACTFDVEFTPSSIQRGSVDAGHGKRPLVTIDADSFDLF